MPNSGKRLQPSSNDWSRSRVFGQWSPAVGNQNQLFSTSAALQAIRLPGRRAAESSRAVRANLVTRKKVVQQCSVFCL